jgi:hypothetical protein
MAAGNTTTGSLADSLPTVISAARIVRENEGVMVQCVDVQKLGEGIGTTWNEVSFAQLEAQAITETETLDNPQQLSDTLLTITPEVVGISTLITDRVAARISKNAYAKIGVLAQNAIQRKKDKDGITVLDSATTSLCSTGTTLTSGHIAAGVSRISSNSTEPGTPPYYAVLHGYQIKDIHDEFTNPVGTYPIPEGETARAFREGFKGMINGARIMEDGNITISSNDAKGGVFAKEGIILVQGRSPHAETKRRPEVGGGATEVFLYDEYAYGERSSGNWLYEIYSDATAPTS